MDIELQIDEEANTAYIHLGPPRPTHHDTVLGRMGVIFNWDINGGLVRIELLDARSMLGSVWDRHLKRDCV